MNVLSLFDGMSGGQIALNQLNIKVDKYFSSEIDKFTIKVTQENYPNTIQIGDIKDVDTNKLPKIDLLIGGSPCQGFSFAGKQLNFEDPRSKLFFEYARILKEIKPKYFLLENVKMKKEYQDIITEYLGVEPISINSEFFSAQRRERLFWTNIKINELPNENKTTISDILEPKFSNNLLIDKCRIKNYWITKNYFQYDISGKKHKSQDQRAYFEYSKHGTLQAHGASSKVKVYYNNGFIRKLTPIECERLQTVPDNYTNFVSNSQRYKMLGNGWTIEVIKHILKNIK